MWLFSTPKDYSAMMKKIATAMFFISLFIIIFLSHFSKDISSFMESISLGFKLEYSGIKLFISYLYFPLIFATCENIFILHDKISDLFGIRYRFDKNVIISEFLSKLNLVYISKKICRKNRDAIMHNIFYKYASSTNPKIDRHLIDLAFNAWSWYWILLDTVVCVVIAGITWLICSFSRATVVAIFSIAAFLLIIMFFIKGCQCRKYALQEVEAILNLKNSHREIRRYLSDAL